MTTRNNKVSAPVGSKNIDGEKQGKPWLMVLLLIIGGAGAATGPVLVDLISGRMTGAVDQALIIDDDEFTVDDVSGGYDARFVATSDDGTQFQVAVEANNGDLFKIRLPITNRGNQDMVAQIELPWNLQGQPTGIQVDLEAMYWWVDANHNNQLDEGEAVVLTTNATLDPTDEIMVPGAADFGNFTADHYFFDDGGLFNNNTYDYPEAIFLDTNSNNQVDPGLLDGSGDRVVAEGTADLKEDEGLGVDLLAYYDTMGNGMWDHGDDIFVNLDGDMYFTTDPDTLINYAGSNLRPGPGTEAPITAGDPLALFNETDNLYWQDISDPGNVNLGDDLWIDEGDDGVYNANGQSVSAPGPAVQLLAVFDAQFDISFNGGAVVTIMLENSGQIVAETLSRVGLEAPSPSPVGAPVENNGNMYIIGDKNDFGEGSTADLIGAYPVPGDSLKGTYLNEQTFSSWWQVGGDAHVTSYSWFIDADHDSLYDEGEAILDQRTGLNDILLEEADTVTQAGLADLTKFTGHYRFFDGSGLLNNNLYDPSEAILFNGDGDNFFDAGVLDTAPDVLVKPGKAALAEDLGLGVGILAYYDPGSPGWDFGEDIYINYDGDAYFTEIPDELVNYAGSNLRMPGSIAPISSGDPLTAFDAGDDVYWNDQGTTGRVDSGDALWIDAADDGRYNANGMSVSDLNPTGDISFLFDGQLNVALDGGPSLTLTLENSGAIAPEMLSVLGLEGPSVSSAGTPVGIGNHYYIVNDHYPAGERSMVQVIGNDGLTGDQTKSQFLYEKSFSSSYQVDSAHTTYLYWFTDDNHNGVYDSGEAVINSIDPVFDYDDTVVADGLADLTQFTADDYFFDAGGAFDNDLFDAWEAIIRDTNGDGVISPGYLDSTPDVLLGIGFADVTEDLYWGVDHLAYHDTGVYGEWAHDEDIFLNHDGDSYYTPGPDLLVNYAGSNMRPSAGSWDPMVRGQPLSAFDAADDLYWYDQGDAFTVDSGDVIWQDMGDDGYYNANGQSVSGNNPNTALAEKIDWQFDIAFNGGSAQTITLENSGVIYAEDISVTGLEAVAPSQFDVGEVVQLGSTGHHYIIISVSSNLGPRSGLAVLGNDGVGGHDVKGNDWALQCVAADGGAQAKTNGGSQFDSDGHLTLPVKKTSGSGNPDLSAINAGDVLAINDDSSFDPGTIFAIAAESGTSDDPDLRILGEPNRNIPGNWKLYKVTTWDSAYSADIDDYFLDNPHEIADAINEEINSDGEAVYDAPGFPGLYKIDSYDTSVDSFVEITNTSGAGQDVTPYLKLGVEEGGLEVGPDAIYCGSPTDDVTNGFEVISDTTVGLVYNDYDPDGSTTGAFDDGEDMSEESVAAGLTYSAYEDTVVYAGDDGQQVSGGEDAWNFADEDNVMFIDASHEGCYNPGEILLWVDGPDVDPGTGLPPFGEILERADGSGQWEIADQDMHNFPSNFYFIDDNNDMVYTHFEAIIDQDSGSDDNLLEDADTLFQPGYAAMLPFTLVGPSGQWELGVHDGSGGPADLSGISEGDLILLDENGDPDDGAAVWAIALDDGSSSTYSLWVATAVGTEIPFNVLVWKGDICDTGSYSDIDDYYLDSHNDIALALDHELGTGGEALWSPPGFTNRFKIDSADTSADSYVEITDTSGLGTNVAGLLKLGLSHGGYEFGPDGVLYGGPSDDATTGFEVVTGSGVPLAFNDNDNDGMVVDSAYQDGQDIYQESVAGALSYSELADKVVYDGGTQQVCNGCPATGFIDSDEVMYIDSDHDLHYDTGEPLLFTLTDTNPGGDLEYHHEVLERADGLGMWEYPDMDTHQFPESFYYTDATGDDSYTSGEAIVDQSLGTDNTLLEEADTVVAAGCADIHIFPYVIILPDGTLSMGVSNGSGGPTDMSSVMTGDLLLLDENGDPSDGSAIWVIAAQVGSPVATSIEVLGAPGTVIPNCLPIWQGNLIPTGVVSDVDDFYLDSAQDIADAISHEISGQGVAYYNPLGFPGLYKIDSNDITAQSAVNITPTIGLGTNAALLLNLGPFNGGVEAGPGKVLYGAPTDDVTMGVEVISGPTMPLAFNDADPDGTVGDERYQDGQDIYQESNGGGGSYSDGEDYIIYNGTDGVQAGPGSIATGFNDTDDIMYRDATHDDFYTIGELLLYTNGWDIDEGGFLRDDTEVLERADGPMVWWIPQQDMHNFPNSYQYIDDNQNGEFDSDEAIINHATGTDDELLDNGDTIVRPGKANLLKMGVVNVRPGVWKFLVPGWFEPLEIQIIVAITDDSATGFYTWTGTLKPVNV